ncbi:hypothetical protein M3I54_31775 [Paraburkholderia sp. CNPSo 3274]|uniref:hypothetical protein n=1 Tax=unclassified Paraburkholderia TaxID=2615204 RepID=UPI0020B8FCA1|nr:MULTISPECIES: hypothetical protein [unclassified Paraburkholderia]MCP3711490.1 hypothetical protein [Paraburkholderia sp. CNPSo 3274]MCP3721389.1 hypothetical protein [Paraburkholderia sp. CNPSo 3281]
MSSNEGDHVMISVPKPGRQAAKRHPVHLAGLVAIAAVAVAYGLQTQPLERDAVGLTGGSHEKAWAAVAATGDAGKFVALNYRTCIEARDTSYTMTDWWLTVVHSRLNTAAQCGLKTVSRASMKGDAFVAQVKGVIGSLPVQIAVPDQPARTLRWFVIDDRPT